MEMTGLNVDTEVIIEVAAVVTDLELNPLHNYHAVVNQPHHYLDAMDDWNQKHHKESGLLTMIPKGKKPEAVERELIELVAEFFKDERAIIAGNSIAQDRLFIDRYMPNLAKKLHYRMLDVSSWKILLKERFGVVYEKKNAHRAVDDIMESISELKYYLSFLQIPPSSNA